MTARGIESLQTSARPDRLGMHGEILSWLGVRTCEPLRTGSNPITALFRPVRTPVRSSQKCALVRTVRTHGSHRSA
jgi:hypothetical protein